MIRVRRVVHRIALAWLLCQAAALTLAPMALAIGTRAAALECQCTHGDHAVCPMHHKPEPESRICLITAAGDDEAAVLSWLMHLGILPPLVPSAVSEPPQVLAGGEFTTASLRPAPPDPPPPRL